MHEQIQGLAIATTTLQYTSPFDSQWGIFVWQFCILCSLPTDAELHFLLDRNCDDLCSPPTSHAEPLPCPPFNPQTASYKYRGHQRSQTGGWEGGWDGHMPTRSVLPSLVCHTLWVFPDVPTAANMFSQHLQITTKMRRKLMQHFHKQQYHRINMPRLWCFLQQPHSRKHGESSLYKQIGSFARQRWMAGQKEGKSMLFSHIHCSQFASAHIATKKWLHVIVPLV